MTENAPAQVLEQEHRIIQRVVAAMSVMADVGGDPLVRHRELDALVPALLEFWNSTRGNPAALVQYLHSQQGDDLEEMLTAQERRRVISELLELPERYPRLDMRRGAIQAFANPPSSPEECVFAQFSASLCSAAWNSPEARVW